jgi:hypothetical protein
MAPLDVAAGVGAGGIGERFSDVRLPLSAAKMSGVDLRGDRLSGAETAAGRRGRGCRSARTKVPLPQMWG